MIDNTWDNYQPEFGDYFKTDSVSEETLRKFAKHFNFYDVEGLIEDYTSNPECYYLEGEFIGADAGEYSSREINIPEILYHINKPKKTVCDNSVDTDEDYVFDHMNFQPKDGEFFDLSKHTPAQRQWLQENLKTWSSSTFISKWTYVKWGGEDFAGTFPEPPRHQEIHINDILA